MPFGVAEIDGHLPGGGLAFGAPGVGDGSTGGEPPCPQRVDEAGDKRQLAAAKVIEALGIEDQPVDPVDSNGSQDELFSSQANANVRYLKRGGTISVPFDSSPRGT